MRGAMKLLKYLDERIKAAEAAGQRVAVTILPVADMREMIDKAKNEWEKKRFPDNEQEVLVIVEHRLPGKKPHRRVIRAFYEDGLIPVDESTFFWDDIPEGPVPAGWYETTDYGGNYEVSDPVIGWRPLPDPWETEH